MAKPHHKLIATGEWGTHVSWKLHETSLLPPVELCTAVMCVAIIDQHVVLARSKRGWGLLGGHIEPGETLEEALHREVREEGGFIIHQYQLFAVHKITARVQASRRPDKAYPIPVSYIAHYWATTSQPLQSPTGAEILASASFALNDLPALSPPDQAIVEAGWEAYRAQADSMLP